MKFLNDFDTIVLDMNDTFAFGGDRFSLTEDYFATYQKLGGERMNASQVCRAINGAFTTMDAIYRDPNHFDDFPSVLESLNTIPESMDLADSEKDLLVDVFAIHELGTISPEHVKAITKLAQSHKLYLVSNVWSPKRRFCELLSDCGIESCFVSIVFSSDSRSVKPSPKLLESLVNEISLERCLLVGDSLRCDVQLAQRVGMKSCWISHGRNLPRDASPDFITRSLLCLNENSFGHVDSPPSDQVLIECDTLRFRRTKMEDLDFVLDAENEPENSPYIVNWSLKQHQESLHDSGVEHLVLESRETGERVGYIILRGLAIEYGSIELKRIVITKKRCGYGLAALKLLKLLTFELLGRRRLWLNVLPDNTRARMLYFRAGFRYEGTWRDSFRIENGHADLELLTALATDDESETHFQIGSNAFRVTRRVDSGHFQQLFKMYDQQWPDKSRTHEDLERALLGSEFIVGIVEESTNDLVAFSRVVTDRGFRAWIHGVLVREDFRGIGLGRRLMDCVMSSRELVGIHSVCLTCATEKNSFYRQWGFEVVEDETVMTRRLRD